MDEENFKEFADPYFKIPSESWEMFTDFLRPKSFKMNEIIKQSHKNESNLYLITKGSSGQFVYKDGHDIYIDLCYEGDYTGDCYSLLSPNRHKASFLGIDFANYSRNSKKT